MLTVCSFPARGTANRVGSLAGISVGTSFHLCVGVLGDCSFCPSCVPRESGVSALDKLFETLQGLRARAVPGWKGWRIDVGCSC